MCCQICCGPYLHRGEFSDPSYFLAPPLKPVHFRKREASCGHYVHCNRFSGKPISTKWNLLNLEWTLNCLKVSIRFALFPGSFLAPWFLGQTWQSLPSSFLLNFSSVTVSQGAWREGNWKSRTEETAQRNPCVSSSALKTQLKEPHLLRQDAWLG